MMMSMFSSCVTQMSNVVSQTPGPMSPYSPGYPHTVLLVILCLLPKIICLAIIVYRFPQVVVVPSRVVWMLVYKLDPN